MRTDISKICIIYYFEKKVESILLGRFRILSGGSDSTPPGSEILLQTIRESRKKNKFFSPPPPLSSLVDVGSFFLVLK